MRKFKEILFGFLGFLIISILEISLSIVIYSYIEHLKPWLIAIIILFVVIVATALCVLVDYIRRKLTFDKPMQEILDATKKMSKGDFNINLKTSNNYLEYDEFDSIKQHLNQMAKELSNLEMLKSDFISNVSHEIKTPLSVINMYAKELSNESLSVEAKRKYTKTLQKACSKLTNLVNNILKLNKLENQKLTPNFKTFNITELLAQQIVTLESKFIEKNIDLKVDIEDDLYINSEESFIEIIINNLISNAIKFTNENGEVKISLYKEKQNIVFIVKDNGIGMDENTGKHIFDKFYQGDTSHSKQGNGLGLTLVKKVIDVIGGCIEVSSELNKGSTFKVTIKEN